MSVLIVAGGAGFIGSNFVRFFVGRHPDWKVIVFDKLTYAGNPDNLKDLEGNPNFSFVQGDICDEKVVKDVLYGADWLINFAAESHVDRSILGAASFIQTDVYGTYVLLEAVRQLGIKRFVQVSTDEVYGSAEQGAFKESAPLNPSSPYSASKAGGDLLCLAYHKTYGTPVIITRSTNNFGPYQYPEKFIPLLITNAIDDTPLPIYGDGLQRRDWIYVLDHCAALDVVLERGQPGEVYNIGTGNERVNIDVAKLILKLLGKPESLIRHVEDRPGHDRRYAVETGKIHSLGWQPKFSFEEALEQTVRWYVENKWWWRKIKENPDFKAYYHHQYGQRQTIK